MKFSVPTTIIEQKLVTVAYINEKVEVESSPQSFSDFNSWVRSRFGLKSTDKISFRNFAGAGMSKHAFRPYFSIQNKYFSGTDHSSFFAF